MGLPGVRFCVDGERLIADSERPLTDDDRAYIRQHKAELMAEVKRKRRRDEVLMLLADNPGVKYAYVTDADTDPVIIAVAIRDSRTFEMSIPLDRYDPFKLLQLFDGESAA